MGFQNRYRHKEHSGKRRIMGSFSLSLNDLVFTEIEVGSLKTNGEVALKY